MTSLQALILGIIQGITEFLPISSSGHLVLTPHLFNWDIPSDQAFVFDVLVQLGTLLAVFVYFWKDISEITKDVTINIFKPENYHLPNVRLGFYLIIAFFPAAIAGLIFKDQIEALFDSPMITAIFLFSTALFLFLAEALGKQSRKYEEINWIDALMMGIFQAMALFPGVSRSGATISVGMLRHLDRPAAARFSFLMSVPIMLAAGLYTSLGLLEINNLSAFIGPMLIGFLSSALVGYLAIRWLIKFLSSHPLYYFSIYLIVLSTLILILN